jgi:3-oxoacyl-[acyl-carrier-protein] synthase III
MNRYAKISGTGAYVPEKILTNDDLSRMLGENIDEFVSQVIGICERHICAENEDTIDLAVAAGLKALEDAHTDPEELDLILVATDTPAYITPATSAVVQHRLGAKRAGTFDINCACAGFVTALDAATKYIIADPAYNKVLVIGAYAISKFLDWKDKKTSTIFADGAGAVVLQKSEKPGYLASKLYADGQYHSYLGIFAGGASMPITGEVLKDGKYNKVRFIQKYPPEVNIEGWQSIINDVLERAELRIQDINLFLFTQVNLSTIKIVMERMEVPMTLTHTIMEKWGYTGSGCIPMALDDAVKQGKLKDGDQFIMCASGGGLNMACSVFRWLE